MKMPMVPISWGELIDKITILEIKKSKIKAAQPLANVEQELTLLNSIIAETLESKNGLKDLKHSLSEINLKLWAIEDDIRAKEHAKEFDTLFIHLARSVYITNDKRAEIKRRINNLMQSDLHEEKIYTAY